MFIAQTSYRIQEKGLWQFPSLCQCKRGGTLRNQYTITGFICHYYVGNIFKASFLEKMKKIRSKLQVLAARKNKLLQFSDFTLLPLTQLHS